MASIDEGYLARCREFPLQIIHSPEVCVEALKVLRKYDGMSRANLGDGERLYLETLRILIESFQRGYIGYLRTHPVPDCKVLKYLLACNHYPDGADGARTLSQHINYPPDILIDVLAGKDTLCREAVAKISRLFKVQPDVFDFHATAGRDTVNRRFRIFGGGGGPFYVKDTKTNQEVDAGTGKNAVAVGDKDGDTFMLDPQGMGFKEEWEYQLNEEPDLTLQIFFKETWAAVEAQREEEDNAVRRLNATRRMFYILDHCDLPDGEELVVAPPGCALVHEEWYENLDVSHRKGWDEHVRGAWYPTANLMMFYIGEEHTSSDKVRQTMLRWLPKVVEAMGVPGDCKLGLGTIQGKPGEVWQPQYEWGLVSSRLADIQLCT